MSPNRVKSSRFSAWSFLEVPAGFLSEILIVVLGNNNLDSDWNLVTAS